MNIISFDKTPWMTKSQYERYMAMCVMAECAIECLNEKNRDGWLLCSRVMRRLTA